MTVYDRRAMMGIESLDQSRPRGKCTGGAASIEGFGCASFLLTIGGNVTMSEPFVGERRVEGYAEKREKASIVKETAKIEWQRAVEVTSREECERLNKDPRAKFEYRWVEK